MTLAASGSGRNWRRRIRNLGIVAVTVAGLVLCSTTANLVIENAERSSIAPYGQRVQVSHGELNVYRAPGAAGTPETIVLLSGLGTPAPALDFGPLIRELHDYQVVVVEGFGYGYSDVTPVDRTVENITAELHEALTKLNIDRPYILAGHSIAGFYTLFYASQYRAEVSAVVGIDPTVPAAGTGRLTRPNARQESTGAGCCQPRVWSAGSPPSHPALPNRKAQGTQQANVNRSGS